MTSSTARGIAVDKSMWNRRKHIMPGQRLYSSSPMAMWLAGKPLATKAQVIELTPDAASAPWISDADLARLVDGDDVTESDRYMSVTERLRRLWLIASQFAHRRSVFFVHMHCVRPFGILLRMENDGPTDFWRAWTGMVRATLPANDSNIFERAATTEKPKNGHLADSLKPLLAWRKMSTPIALGGTNWMLADNDNYAEGEERPASNLQRRIRPGSSDEELRSYIKNAGPCGVRKHAQLGGGGAWELEPTDITLESVPEVNENTGKVTKRHMTIVRAGKLRIANGKTKDGGRHVEEGTVMYQPDKFGEMMGPEPNPAEKLRSASYWASLFKVERSSVIDTDVHGNEELRFIKAGKMRRKVRFTAEDHAALLAGPLPPVTHCPPGLPRGAEDIGAQFVGGWISNPKGKAPPERWEDISDEMARQGEFERWVAALPADQQRALNIASTAANLQEVGEAFGKKEKTAERYGKKILKAANDNLKKLAAA